jgi:hypothetical protein
MNLPARSGRAIIPAIEFLLQPAVFMLQGVDSIALRRRTTDDENDCDGDAHERDAPENDQFLRPQAKESKHRFSGANRADYL